MLTPSCVDGIEARSGVAVLNFDRQEARDDQPFLIHFSQKLKLNNDSIFASVFLSYFNDVYYIEILVKYSVTNLKDS